MSGTLIGYARCSTDKQDLTAQRDRLRELGVTEKRIYLVVSLAAASPTICARAPIRRAWLGDHWFTVAGVLHPLELRPGDRPGRPDRPADRGRVPRLRRSPDPPVPAGGHRADRAGRHHAARATNPAQPDTVDVSRPSDALASRLLVTDSLTSLLLGLGAIALLVGGVGIANMMVISVLERRTEIGLRRALGATRRHIAVRFLSESLLLSALGGVAGGVLGTAAPTPSPRPKAGKPWYR